MAVQCSDKGIFVLHAIAHCWLLPYHVGQTLPWHCVGGVWIEIIGCCASACKSRGEKVRYLVLLYGYFILKVVKTNITYVWNLRLGREISVLVLSGCSISNWAHPFLCNFTAKTTQTGSCSEMRLSPCVQTDTRISKSLCISIFWWMNCSTDF